jgi:hypothetical protein
MKKILVVALVVAVALIGVTAVFAYTDHQSISCRTCHTPHNAGSMTPIPLWDTVGAAARLASAGTGTNAPAGSIMCAVCHDGTGVVDIGRTDVWADSGANDHPVGVPSGPHGTGAAPLDTATGVIYIAGNVECISCHYVHNDTAIQNGHYVRLTPIAGATRFCKTCHVGW